MTALLTFPWTARELVFPLLRRFSKAPNSPQNLRVDVCLGNVEMSVSRDGSHSSSEDADDELFATSLSDSNVYFRTNSLNIPVNDLNVLSTTHSTDAASDTDSNILVSIQKMVAGVEGLREANSQLAEDELLRNEEAMLREEGAGITPNLQIPAGVNVNVSNHVRDRDSVPDLTDNINLSSGGFLSGLMSSLGNLFRSSSGQQGSEKVMGTVGSVADEASKNDFLKSLGESTASTLQSEQGQNEAAKALHSIEKCSSDSQKCGKSLVKSSAKTVEDTAGKLIKVGSRKELGTIADKATAALPLDKAKTTAQSAAPSLTTLQKMSPPLKSLNSKLHPVSSFLREVLGRSGSGAGRARSRILTGDDAAAPAKEAEGDANHTKSKLGESAEAMVANQEQKSERSEGDIESTKKNNADNDDVSSSGSTKATTMDLLVPAVYEIWVETQEQQGRNTVANQESNAVQITPDRKLINFPSSGRARRTKYTIAVVDQSLLGTRFFHPETRCGLKEITHWAYSHRGMVWEFADSEYHAADGIHGKADGDVETFESSGLGPLGTGSTSRSIRETERRRKLEATHLGFVESRQDGSEQTQSCHIETEEVILQSAGLLVLEMVVAEGNQNAEASGCQIWRYLPDGMLESSLSFQASVVAQSLSVGGESDTSEPSADSSVFYTPYSYSFDSTGISRGGSGTSLHKRARGERAQKGHAAGSQGVPTKSTSQTNWLSSPSPPVSSLTSLTSILDSASTSPATAKFVKLIWLIFVLFFLYKSGIIGFFGGREDANAATNLNSMENGLKDNQLIPVPMSMDTIEAPNADSGNMLTGSIRESDNLSESDSLGQALPNTSSSYLPIHSDGYGELPELHSPTGGNANNTSGSRRQPTARALFRDDSSGDNMRSLTEWNQKATGPSSRSIARSFTASTESKATFPGKFGNDRAHNANITSGESYKINAQTNSAVPAAAHHSLSPGSGERERYSGTQTGKKRYSGYRPPCLEDIFDSEWTEVGSGNNITINKNEFLQSTSSDTVTTDIAGTGELNTTSSQAPGAAVAAHPLAGSTSSKSSSTLANNSTATAFHYVGSSEVMSKDLDVDDLFSEAPNDPLRNDPDNDPGAAAPDILNFGQDLTQNFVDGERKTSVSTDWGDDAQVLPALLSATDSEPGDENYMAAPLDDPLRAAVSKTSLNINQSSRSHNPTLATSSNTFSTVTSHYPLGSTLASNSSSLGTMHRGGKERDNFDKAGSRSNTSTKSAYVPPELPLSGPK